MGDNLNALEDQQLPDVETDRGQAVVNEQIREGDRQVSLEVPDQG